MVNFKGLPREDNLGWVAGKRRCLMGGAAAADQQALPAPPCPPQPPNPTTANTPARMPRMKILGSGYSYLCCPVAAVNSYVSSGNWVYERSARQGKEGGRESAALGAPRQLAATAAARLAPTACPPSPAPCLPT